MQAFLVSAAVVAVAEFGDKTQLLALMLAARFRRPLPILLGIASAALANHVLAGAVGAGIAAYLGPALLKVLLGGSFIAMGLWALRPQRAAVERRVDPRLGVFGATLVAYFLAEMGDKTQIATIALAAHYRTLVPVVAGSTAGMVAIDALAVLLGRAAAERLPRPLIRGVAAAGFVAFGAVILLGAA